VKIDTLTLLLRAGPLAALPLFAGFTLPGSKAPSIRLGDTAYQIALDIKPGSCPNPINVNQPDSAPELIDGMMLSVIPVSILGNKFDVDQVDLGSVALSRTGFDGEIQVFPIQLNFADTGTPFEGGQCECHDLTGDEVMDLDLKFSKQEVIDAFGLQFEEDGAFIELKVTGVAKGVREFVGRDCIRIINHP